MRQAGMSCSIELPARVLGQLDLPQLLNGANRYGKLGRASRIEYPAGHPLPRKLQTALCQQERAMSVILRILFVLAGSITAFFVRGSLNFDIIQTFVAILLVTALLLGGSVWSLLRKT
ncbi:hypothetical protein ACQPTN_08715 [Bradyrhizobium sp. 13971]